MLANENITKSTHPATWPREVQQLARDFLSSAQGWIHINIGSQELSANHNILQVYFYLNQRPSDDYDLMT